MIRLELKKTFQDILQMTDTGLTDFLNDLRQLLSLSMTEYTYVRALLHECSYSDITNETIEKLKKSNVFVVSYDGISLDVNFYNYSTNGNPYRIKSSRTKEHNFDLDELISVFRDQIDTLRRDITTKKDINSMIIKHFFKIKR